MNPGTTASAGVFFHSRMKRAAPESTPKALPQAPLAATLEGFPPLASAASRVLVLGSMPGAASLRAGEYYAHPRNQFWTIIRRLFGIGAELPYAGRCRRLVACRVAVWDVIGRCERRGSLDSGIETSSIVVNDFATFFRRHRRVGFVFFNGLKAEQVYDRHVRESAPGAGRALQYRRLPSTSPAHAALSVEDKLKQWRAVAECARARGAS